MADQGKHVNHEQNQSMCALQWRRIRDVSRSTPTRKKVGLFVQAVREGGESGQPLLPLRRDVERVAAERV